MSDYDSEARYEGVDEHEEAEVFWFNLAQYDDILLEDERLCIYDSENEEAETYVASEDYVALEEVA